MNELKIPSEGLGGWLKQPSTWASLVAVLVSIFTFYSTNFDDGAIQIYLPQQLGVQFSNYSNFCFRVPVVLYNTAPQNKWKTVREMAISAQIQGESAPLSHNWNTLLRFISKYEFEKNYPDFAQKDATDYAIYDSRVIPISISGKQSESKLVDFDCAKHPVNLTGPFNLDLSLRVTTMEGQTYNSTKYSYTISKDNFVWKDSGLYAWATQVSN